MAARPRARNQTQLAPLHPARSTVWSSSSQPGGGPGAWPRDGDPASRSRSFHGAAPLPRTIPCNMGPGITTASRAVAVPASCDHSSPWSPVSTGHPDRWLHSQRRQGTDRWPRGRVPASRSAAGPAATRPGPGPADARLVLGTRQ